MPQKCGISLPAYGADIHNMHAWQRRICMHAVRTADGDWILLTGKKTIRRSGLRGFFGKQTEPWYDCLCRKLKKGDRNDLLRHS